MNETRAFHLLSLVLLLLAGACSRQSDVPPLQGAKLENAFTLVDGSGQRVSDSQFTGKYRLVYFGFTYCPDVCPVDLQNIGKAIRQLEKSDPKLAERLQPIFISVDPERDTPAVMKQYVSAFHPRLIGLTGTKEQIAAVAKKHGVFFQKEDGTAPGEYLVNHSRIALLFGPKGEPIAIIPHDGGAEAIATELKRWVA
jgi:protein SCO1/2